MNKITQFDLQSRFGLSEFETLAADILNFILNEKKSNKVGMLDRIPLYDRGEGFDTQFSIEEVTNHKVIFAMFCAAGFIQNSWFPKGYFRVSQAFVNRLKGCGQNQKEMSGEIKKMIKDYE